MIDTDLKWIKFIGNAATFATVSIVIIKLGWWALAWWLPLHFLIEFGCFAERDIKWHKRLADNAKSEGGSS